MKKYISKILSVAFMLTVGGMTSCTDYLDKSPLSEIDEVNVYKNFNNYQGFVEELYNCIPLVTSFTSHSSWNLGEDEYWEPTETRMVAYAIDQGNYWGWESCYYSWFHPGGSSTSEGDSKTSKGNLWGLSWYAISKANLGIANLDKLTDATTEERNLIAGQLYFFRGWFHFMLMQYWGGLPYIDDILPTSETIKLPRLSYQETADKVGEDIQRAVELLPVDWDNTTVGKATLGKNNIRINKVMALGFLGKNYLWAGSPLMNKVSGENAGYNTDYCKKAADSFAQALQICESTKRYELADFSQYNLLFYTYNQSGKIPGLKEAIFYENLIQSGTRWRWNQVNDYRPMTINGSGIKVYPTANYVNYYGMVNGLPITNSEERDPESGYDPEYPWRDRDPRFYNDIMVDGERCVRDGSRVGNNQYRQYASLFDGGLYRTDNPPKAVFTGYMNSKFTSKYMNDWDGYRENNVMVLSLMRLADVYLMYAEATLYGYGSPQSKAGNYTLTALDAVNKIRKRAGVDGIHSKFLGSNETFMSELRRERAVELAFEGHRFVDLRRWMLLLEKPYTQKTAVYYDRFIEDPSNPDDFSKLYADPINARVLNLHEKILFERQFEEKHYWFPFRQADVKMYAEFKQNPGW